MPRLGLLAAALAALLALACLDPADRRPGLRLPGEIVRDRVDDWSFTQAHPEIWIETRTPYLVPHSVTIVCAARKGRLYVGARHPEDKRWVSWVDRDPNVRLKIGEQVFEQRLVPVEGEAAEKVYEAYVAKYGWEPAPASERPPLRYWEVVERS